MHGTHWREALARYNRYRVLPPPMAGGAPDGDDGKSGDDGKPPADPPKGGDKSGDGDGNDDGDKDGDGKGDDGGRGDLNKALAEERRQRQAAERKLAERDAKDREAEREDAAKKGEFQKLYGDLKAESEKTIGELRAELRNRDVERALLDYLGEKHPAHVAKLRWIRPVLMAEIGSDQDDDGIQATVKRVADDYVKDHPVSASDGGKGRGAPGAAGKDGGDKPPRNPLGNFPGLKEFSDHMTGADLAAK